jgi:hypothetical protein
VVFIQSSLDTTKQTPPFFSVKSSPSWSKKQKRAFSCAFSGLKKCFYNRKAAFFLTLTSSPLTNHLDLRRDWEVLVKRIKRLFPDFQYIKVETFEGYGVIHALYHSAFKGWLYRDIHAWLSKNWFEVHKAFIVWNTLVGSKVNGYHFSMKRCAAYLCQYMGCQHGFFRRSTSKDWLFPRYRAVFLGLINKLGYKEGLQSWEFLLMNGLKVDSSIQFPIGI